MGVKAGVDEGHLYAKQVHTVETSLLYDAYLKWLVNSSPKPDSLLVRKYYDENKDVKYIDPEMVRVREIRVDSFELSEQLWEEAVGGADFESLARQHSRTNPSGGGLVAPFPLGKYNDMGSVAFGLDVGEISSVIENLDKTFSIIRLEEKLPEQYSSFRRVYSRIESLLLRDLQNKSKSDGVDGLYKKFDVVINSDFIGISKNDEN
jgi:parvulin-like peptidyl-prolyl isomerase